MKLLLAITLMALSLSSFSQRTTPLYSDVTLLDKEAFEAGYKELLKHLPENGFYSVGNCTVERKDHPTLPATEGTLLIIDDPDLEKGYELKIEYNKITLRKEDFDYNKTFGFQDAGPLGKRFWDVTTFAFGHEVKKGKNTYSTNILLIVHGKDDWISKETSFSFGTDTLKYNKKGKYKSRKNHNSCRSTKAVKL